jgi:hypothetical protein
MAYELLMTKFDIAAKTGPSSWQREIGRKKVGGYLILS